MKKKIVIIILSLIVLFFTTIAYKSLVKTRISVVLPDEIIETFGEKALAGPNWGLTSIICKQGGFDILPYAGKEVTLESSLAVGKFHHATPLNLFTVYADGKVICKYYTDSTGLLIPGIFAINDPNITGKEK